MASSDSDSGFVLYNYAPSRAAAILFAILFYLSTFMHIFQMVKSRTWYMIAFIVGALCEGVGYAFRAKSASEKQGEWTLIPYIIQNILLLIPPSLFAASIYMILGRIILLTDGEHLSMVKRTRLTKIFVLGDLFSFMMQSGGGSMMATMSDNPDMMKMAEHVIIGGLLLQVLFFGFFVAVAGVFHKRLSSRPTAKSQQPEIRWKSYLTTLYFVSFLIMIRSIFRLIEYIQGSDGMIMKHEYFLYIFDSSLMFAVVVWMNWKHPAEIGILLRAQDSDGIPLFAPRYKLSGESV